MTLYTSVSEVCVWVCECVFGESSKWMCKIKVWGVSGGWVGKWVDEWVFV